MLVIGVSGFILELLGVPLAPIVLGLNLGAEVEHKFLQCITKDASVSAFLGSPISIVLAVVCVLLWAAPAVTTLLKRKPGTNG